ncbi:ABC transporter substrate-binding protein [Brevibacillus ruminantium]|uniref:ABC transporter substrate-binding protein n=1 Tax=Brevibacillus ruminantium TaxID=2950604 RepID=A0ABY4WS59_9BACL|nr:ABC transporter substrate-binding protein [Brevibacillus ruminantium]USG67421.1 ABC transporter substrate-binding protein [Brevibacillus ruminantium]
MERLANDYLMLMKAFPEQKEKEPRSVTMAELSNILFCTPRNVKLIFTKMEQMGWIRYTPGRGRGHTSELSFLIGREKFLARQTEELVMAGHVERAFQLIKEFGEGTAARENLFSWLSGYFGYEAVANQDQPIETLRLPIYRSIHTWDPAGAIYSHDLHMVSQVFDTLVSFDVEWGRFKPGISHYWEADREGTSWTFYLRKGILFHHGRELVADDVAFSLSRLKQMNSGQSWLADQIQEITILSRYALNIKLEKANYLFLAFMSYPPSSILPKDVYAQDGTDSLQLPVGSGPYRVGKVTPGLCVLEAFDHYFNGRAFIDRVEIMIMPEQGELADGLGKGNVLKVKTGEKQLPSADDEQEAEAYCIGTSLLTVNLQKQGPLQALPLRKALSHFLDRQQLVDDMGEPCLYPAYSLQWRGQVSPKAGGDGSHDGEELVESLLCQSGYRGERIQLYTYPRHAPDAEWLKTAYGKLGIMVDVQIVSWKEMLDEEQIRKADLILFEAVVSEGAIKLLEYLQGKNSFIRRHLSPERIGWVDKKLDRLLAEPEEAVRQKHFDEIEETLGREYAWITLTHKNVRAFSHHSLKGVKVNARGWVEFKDLWFQA